MKINIKNLSEILRIDRSVTQRFIKQQQQISKTQTGFFLSGMSVDESDKYIQETFEKILSVNCKRYIITKTATDVIERIKIDKIDMNMFYKIPVNQVWEFMVSPEKIYRTVYDGKLLRGMFISMTKEDSGMMYLKYDSFGFEINQSTGELARETENVEHLRDIVDEWIKILVFIQFSEPVLNILKSGAKHGNNRQNKIKNETPSDYIIVNSKWNTISMRSEGFLVRAHFRLQAYGSGMKERKLILIDEFEKSGYVRNSGKLIHNN
jgi:hypothetical protein